VGEGMGGGRVIGFESSAQCENRRMGNEMIQRMAAGELHLGHVYVQ
jgi:hypothetical protein